MINCVKNKRGNKKFNVVKMIMGVYALVILCIFPVIYHNYYFDILETKYQFYCGVSIVMMITMLIYGLYTNKLIDYLKEINVNKIRKSLSIVDWAILVFWFANVVSWLFCDWRWEAFWGTSGRYNGVFLMSIYTVVYFLVTRFFEMKRGYLDAFLVVSIFVCLFGISDHFQMDLLGFKEHMVEAQKKSYTSTLGNINTYTVYVGTSVCISMILFSLENNVWKTMYYFCVMGIAMVALIFGVSDNAYLTLATVFGLSPLYLFATRRGIRRYLTTIAMFLSAVAFTGWVHATYVDQVYMLTGISKLLSRMSIVPKVAMALWIILFMWGSIARMKHTDEGKEIGIWLRCLWGGMVGFIAIAVVYVLYDANVAHHEETYQSFKQYLIFDDEWGNGRGYVWLRSIEIFNKVFTPIQKLFGYGADTFKILFVQYYPPQGSIVYDSAHNEYLHLLLTVGVVGAGTYFALFAGAVDQMAKTVKENPMILAIVFVILAYAAQALVNINVPVVFPLILQLLAMGLAKTEEN